MSFNVDLRTVFNAFNTNNEGDSKGRIDKEEAKQSLGSIYFLDENMDFDKFKATNADIWLANNNFFSCDDKNRNENGNKLQDAVSRVVLSIINRGNFDSHKEDIISKAKYLNHDTLTTVLSRLNPEEKEQVYQILDDSMSKQEDEFDKIIGENINND